jgi:signal peptidase I
VQTSTKIRRPWLAGVLTLLVPGLGHVYAGRARRGLVLVAGFFVLAVAMLELGMWIPVPAARLLSLALLVGGLVYLVWDAVSSATAVRTSFQPKPYNRWFVYLGVGIGLAVAGELVRALVRDHVARAFVIPSPAMQPTFLPGDYVLTSPRVPDRIPRRTPVVYLTDEGGYAASRVMGVPGDTLEMRDGVLYLDGARQEESYAVRGGFSNHPAMSEMLWQTEFLVHPEPEAGSYRPTLADWGPIVVPPDSYFLLSDNRPHSLDSRYLGYLPHERLVARPRWIYYSREPGAGTRWSRLGRSIR